MTRLAAGRPCTIECMAVLLFVLDITLILLATMRITRLVVFDDLGGWALREPAARWAGDLPARARLVSGLECPWCVGFWIGAAALAALWTAGGPGHAAEWWRYLAGAFALNWVAAHIGPRLGDAGYADYDED